MLAAWQGSHARTVKDHGGEGRALRDTGGAGPATCSPEGGLLLTGDDSRATLHLREDAGDGLLSTYAHQ